MKHLKLFENYDNINDTKLSDYMKNYGHESLTEIKNWVRYFIPDIIKYLEPFFENVYVISKGGFDSSKVSYYLFVDKNKNSVDCTIIVNDKNNTIDINMINSSTIGIGLGKYLIEKIKDYSINNNHSIKVSNVTNESFWEKMGFIKDMYSVYTYN